MTEYGVAYLHGKSIRERAVALIQIAHPSFRDQLMQAALSQGYIYKDQIDVRWHQMAYPEELERYETLADGTEIFFRPVRPTDEPALGDMLYSLSSESVRLRFFSHTKTFPRKEVQQLVSVDYAKELAIVCVVPGPGEGDIVALAQYFRDPKTDAAEIAFVVQDEWQQKGMGTLLLKYLTEIARKRGIKRFHAKVLPSNRSMLAIFHNTGYVVKTEFDGEVYSLSYDLEDKAKG